MSSRINNWKNAIITGAGTGIGLEFANQLAKNGTNLVLIARNSEKLEQIKLRLEAENNINVLFIGIDLTVPDADSQILNFLNFNNFCPDLLINNAGAGVYGNFNISDLEKEINIILLNITTLVRLCKKIIPLMKQHGGGTVLNVSSTLAFRKSPFWAVYSATKAFVLSFSKSLQFEYKNSNISVSVVCPGRTYSSFDENAGVSNRSWKKSDVTEVVKNTLNKLTKSKELIIPGFDNKIKYFVFKYLPEFLTEIIIRKL